MPSDPYADALSVLNADATHRVWSMLVTVFGDLARAPGDAIDGPVLSRILNDIGIKPEATRVALHRLRNDGWITSAKQGRTSRHSLTPQGRKASAAASARIYAAPEAGGDNWQCVLLETASAHSRETMEALGFAPLAPRIFVGPPAARAPSDTLSLTGAAAPPWLGAQFEPKGLGQDYAALHERLVALTRLPLDTPPLTTVQRATLRCLIVHGWRRLVLKHPHLPRALYSEAWRGHDCHALVDALLGRLPRPSLEDLHAS